MLRRKRPEQTPLAPAVETFLQTELEIIQRFTQQPSPLQETWEKRLENLQHAKIEAHKGDLRRVKEIALAAFHRYELPNFAGITEEEREANLRIVKEALRQLLPQHEFEKLCPPQNVILAQERFGKRTNHTTKPPTPPDTVA